MRHTAVVKHIIVYLNQFSRVYFQKLHNPLNERKLQADQAKHEVDMR